MAHQDDYRHWPFLTEEEFNLACAYFDQRYIRAKLGPARKNMKVNSRRTMTTNVHFIEILRLLQPPEDEDELTKALASLGGLGGSYTNAGMDVDMANDDEDEEVLRPQQGNSDGPPGYSLYSHQPYVTYEIHLHPTYRVPTLWFTLHDLPMNDPAFNLDSVYRYLVPDEKKSQMRSAGINGGISAAPHPVTDLPSFFIHPCQTKEAMESFNCPLNDYLLVWLGLVGGCVGLWVPTEMAQENT